MKNEEFRKLLLEYAQEISDPENKKKYEEEISQMEKERGMDIKFVNPEGGFVIKTTRVNDGIKVFVNICHNEHIQKAFSHVAEKEEDGKRKRGEQWSIPFSLSQPRDDLDHSGNKCIVFDVIFNPGTYQKGQQDPLFKETMINTALDGIEKQLNVKLNNKNLKFPKLTFKGMKQTTVIRTKSKEKPEKLADNTIGGMSFPYPYTDKATTEKQENMKPKKKTKHKNTSNNKDDNKSVNSDDGDEKTSAKSNKRTNEPVYHIVHRGVIDFQNFTNARDSCTSTRPKELIVSVELPKLKSTGTVELDIFEKQLILHNDDPPYNLDISFNLTLNIYIVFLNTVYLALPFPVDDANGHAKFDKSKRELVITLPVIKAVTPPLPHTDIPTTDDEEEEMVHDIQEQAEFNSEGHKENYNANSFSESHSKRDSNLPEELTTFNSKDVEDISENLSSKETSEIKSTNMENGLVSDLQSDEVTDENSTVTNNVANKEQFDWATSDEGFIIMDDIVGPSDGGTDQTDIFNSHMDSQDIHFDIPSDLTDMSSPFFFKLPPYSYHQDTDTVTFVVHVAGVVMENVSLGFNDNKCYINFPSENAKPHHLPEPDYALYISFAYGQYLAADNCHIDVSEENLVLTLIKDDACKGLWDGFQAGPGEEELEEKYFITDNNVELMMQEIADQDPWAEQRRYTADLKVLSVADDHLTIELQNKLADAVKENQDTGHVCATQHRNPGNKGSKEATQSTMDSAVLENLELKEGILSNKMQELKLQNLSSPDEGIEYDMYRHERREQYSYGLSERIAVATDPKLVQEHGHKTNVDERRKNRSDSTDSVSSDRSDSSERRKSRSDSMDSVSSDSTAIPTRKSCIRRTSSSTSTDDDDIYELSNMSPSNGSWGSPGKRNVRFNLNPSVRVFSNKKDKQRWKMEQRLKIQKLQYSRENGEDKTASWVDKEATIHEENPQETNNTDESRVQRKDSESSVDEEWTLVDRPSSENSLSNNLIFELDE
ncbi:hypothetical protein QZH41_010189 [Actinostola sp. cb2023]|nr:hypothetical protein QZH41_010189 [Actinostola sp. cb2023]